MKVPSIPAKRFAEEILKKPESLVLIDVREDWEYDDNPNVKERISLYDIPKKIEKLKKYTDKKMVICCRTGVRGNIGAKFLTKNGFTNVYNLEGGFEALMETGAPQKQRALD